MTSLIILCLTYLPIATVAFPSLWFILDHLAILRPLEIFDNRYCKGNGAWFMLHSKGH